MGRANRIPSDFAAPGVEAFADGLAASTVTTAGAKARHETVAGVRVAACQVCVTDSRIEAGDHDTRTVPLFPAAEGVDDADRLTAILIGASGSGVGGGA